MDRQTIMETNKSLRTIKTELENLLEKGVIDDATYDTISSALPDETPLRGAAANTRSANQTPAQNSTPTVPPTNAFQNLSVHNQSPAPPSYNETPPPALPNRSGKPVIARTHALFNYDEEGDLHFSKGDNIEIYEFINEDWWSGRNQRTGQEGIFPKNHVLPVPEEVKAAARAAAYAPPQPTYGYPPGPPAQQNPYNANVPPMAIADGGQPAQGQGSDNKMGEYGKKFGKKLGNAAIFGAGASIGSNIVNSIF